jgi:hypothetical protein
MCLVCCSKTPKETSTLVREGIDHGESFTYIHVYDTWSSSCLDEVVDESSRKLPWFPGV